MTVSVRIMRVYPDRASCSSSSELCMRCLDRRLSCCDPSPYWSDKSGARHVLSSAESELCALGTGMVGALHGRSFLLEAKVSSKPSIIMEADSSSGQQARTPSVAPRRHDAYSCGIRSDDPFTVASVFAAPMGCEHLRQGGAQCLPACTSCRCDVSSAPACQPFVLRKRLQFE